MVAAHLDWEYYPHAEFLVSKFQLQHFGLL